MIFLRWLRRWWDNPPPNMVLGKPMPPGGFGWQKDTAPPRPGATPPGIPPGPDGRYQAWAAYDAALKVQQDAMDDLSKSLKHLEYVMVLALIGALIGLLGFVGKIVGWWD